MTWRDACREPYRVLFPVGVASGCVGIGHWLLYALHLAERSSSFFHASIQMGAYMFCFIAGFLMTALPRFAAAEPASSVELTAVLGLLGLQVVLLSLGVWIGAQLCFGLLLVFLAVFAGRRFAQRRSGVGPPTEFVWIPIAVILGLLGTVLLIIGQSGGPAWALAVGRPMAQQGLVLAVALGVGGFMGPRLMGSRALLVAPVGVSEAQAGAIRRRRILTHLVAGIVFALSFWIEGRGAIRAAYLLRAAVVTAELAWTTRFFHPPAVPDFYVRLLGVSFWMIVLGLWGAGFIPRFRIAMLHLVFLGGISLMTFAVGTMVVMSHAGEGQALRKPMWVLRVVAAGVTCAVAARVLADAWAAYHFLFLGFASAAWLIAGVSWLLFILPRVTRVPAAGTFEALHEEAKRQLLRQAPRRQPKTV